MAGVLAHLVRAQFVRAEFVRAQFVRASLAEVGASAPAPSTAPEYSLIEANDTTNLVSLSAAITLDRASNTVSRDWDHAMASITDDEPAFRGLRRVGANSYSNLTVGGNVIHPIVPSRTVDGVTIPAHLLSAKPLETDETLTSDGDGLRYRHSGGRAYLITSSGTAASSHPSEVGTSTDDDTFSHGTATLQDVGAYQEYCGLIVTPGFTQSAPQSANFADDDTYWSGTGGFTSINSATSIIPGGTAFEHTGDGSTSVPNRQHDDAITGAAGQNLLVQLVLEEGTAATCRLAVQNLVSGFIGRARYVWADDSFVIDNEDNGSVLENRVTVLQASPKVVLVELLLDQASSGNKVRVTLNPCNHNGTTTDDVTIHFCGISEFDGRDLPLIATGATAETVLADTLSVTYALPAEGTARAAVQSLATGVGTVEARVLGSNVAAAPLALSTTSAAVLDTGVATATVGDDLDRTGDDVIASYWSDTEDEAVAGHDGTAGTPIAFSGWTGAPASVFYGSQNNASAQLYGLVKSVFIWDTPPTSTSAAVLSRYD